MKFLSAAGFLTVILAAILFSASPGTAGQMGAKQQKQKRGTVITTGDSAYGKMLFNRDRQAIYLFDLEQTKRSKCYGACAEAWPPVLTKSKPRAKGKTRQRLLGITRRKGGAKQVTYAGQPLYYYAHEGPGQVFCHDVFGYGGTWLVVKPDGKAAA